MWVPIKSLLTGGIVVVWNLFACCNALYLPLNAGQKDQHSLLLFPAYAACYEMVTELMAHWKQLNGDAQRWVYWSNGCIRFSSNLYCLHFDWRCLSSYLPNPSTLISIDIFTASLIRVILPSFLNSLWISPSVTQQKGDWQISSLWIGILLMLTAIQSCQMQQYMLNVFIAI